MEKSVLETLTYKTTLAILLYLIWESITIIFTFSLSMDS